MKAVVESTQREGKMRAHTATHLLHHELGKIIKGTKQAGSLVEDDYIRFDFTASGPISKEKIQQIEDNLNQTIKENLAVYTKTMNFNDALNAGATAFFEEKYQDTVRVVFIGEEQPISIELCGGTHAPNTAFLGAFKIVGQEAVASGIRRIIAYTGTNVVEETRNKENYLGQISQRLESGESNIIEKLDKLIREKQESENELESAKDRLINNSLKTTQTQSNSLFDKIINTSKDENLKNENFKNISKKAKDFFKNENVLIYNEEGNFIIFVGKEGFSAKNIANENGLKGGGSDQLVQGKDENVKNIV